MSLFHYQGFIQRGELGSAHELESNNSIEAIILGGGGRMLPNNVNYVAVTGRKRTLFHVKWANSISYISRMLY